MVLAYWPEYHYEWPPAAPTDERRGVRPPPPGGYDRARRRGRNGGNHRPEVTPSWDRPRYPTPDGGYGGDGRSGRARGFDTSRYRPLGRDRHCFHPKAQGLGARGRVLSLIRPLTEESARSPAGPASDGG
jgi:hypothetical protein